jgi:hypothetical protein
LEVTLNRPVALLLFAVLTSLTRADLQACGDKFLIVTRGSRFQRPSPRDPASVLLYANPASRLTQALSRLPIDVTLKKAGYHTTTVVTAEALSAALQSGRWDVIVADATDVSTLRMSKDETAIVLPVAFDANAAQVEQLKRLYRRVLKSPTRSQSVLDAIDDVISAKTNIAKTARRVG